MTEGLNSLKITVLNDNEPGPGLRNDWGWSVVIESEKWKILFDADTRSDVIEYNTKKIGINVQDIDFAILSHGHLDHYGGFEYIGRMKRGLKVYLPENVGILETWGLETIVIEKPMEIVENVLSTGPLKAFSLREQALIIKGNGFNVLIVGCSHPGIDKIVERAFEMVGRIYLVIGGFHGPSKKQLDNISRFSDFISPAHCSGNGAKNYVRNKFNEKYLMVRTGSIIKIPF